MRAEAVYPDEILIRRICGWRGNMAQKQLNLVVALKNDVIISKENVENGLKCGCTCPACGGA